MRETMLDTIEIFEESIRQQSILLENANTENQELLELIRKLEGQNDSLLQLRMQENLDRFMLENRQRAFASISAGLNNYLSRLKDVHRNFHVVGDYEFPEAKARFDKIIKSYSAARNVVDTLQTSHVHDVTLFWEDENLAQELTSVYQFLLVVVHENEVWTPYFETVEPRLREQLFGKARKSAQAMQERLAPLIRELESRSNNIQKELQKGLNVR